MENLKQRVRLITRNTCTKGAFNVNVLMWIALAYPEYFKKIFSNLGIEVKWPEKYEFRQSKSYDYWYIHNNFIYFICFNYDEYVQDIVQNLKKIDSVKFSDFEFSVHDLSIQNGEVGADTLLVLKNAVGKSPKSYDLEKVYQQNAQNPSTQYILLAQMDEFADREKIEKEKIWKIVTFRDLYEAMGNMDESVDPYAKLIIEDYRGYLLFLSDFAGKCKINGNDSILAHVKKFTGDENCSDLMKDIALKMVAEQMSDMFVEVLSSDCKLGPYFQDIELYDEEMVDIKNSSSIYVDRSGGRDTSSFYISIPTKNKRVIMIDVALHSKGYVSYSHMVHNLRDKRVERKLWEELKKDNVLTALRFFKTDICEIPDYHDDTSLLDTETLYPLNKIGFGIYQGCDRHQYVFQNYRVAEKTTVNQLFGLILCELSAIVETIEKSDECDNIF